MWNPEDLGNRKVVEQGFQGKWSDGASGQVSNGAMGSGVPTSHKLTCLESIFMIGQQVCKTENTEIKGAKGCTPITHNSICTLFLG